MRARSEETLIIARTDAVAVEGFEPAIERARLYAEAGADVLFVEAPRIARAARGGDSRARRRCVPLMANMVEGGETPLSSRAGPGRHRLPAGDLSRRHRARARAGRAGLLPLAAHATAPTSLPRPHVRFHGAERLIGTPGDAGARRALRESLRQTRTCAMSAIDPVTLAVLQGPPRADRRRDGRDALSLGLQPDHRRGARRLPRALSRRRPARRWCRARTGCRSSSAPWRSR